MINNTLEANRCVNCGSLNTTPLFNASDFDTGMTPFPVCSCGSCKLVFTGKVDEDLLSKAYAPQYYGTPNAKFFGGIEHLLSRGHRYQVKKILGLHKAGGSSVEALKVLDIGCGRGLLLAEFHAHGARCTGIERAEFPDQKNSKFSLHVGDIGDAEFNNQRFDVIVIWHVLEHVMPVSRLLEDVYKHLEPGGILVVSVPNFSSWQRILFGAHWFHLDIPRHVVHLDKEWFDSNVSGKKLTVVKQSTFSLSQNIYGFIQSALNVLVPTRPNRLYSLLKRRDTAGDWIGLFCWGLLAGLTTPFALIESVVSAFFKQGATLTLYFRRGIDD
ncbi:MAG: methyltransferase domain-containing protein [Pseudomonadales bacterium]|nr:methyltransferase domain-containing protein [Pseudomonadales bacterium]